MRFLCIAIVLTLTACGPAAHRNVRTSQDPASSTRSATADPPSLSPARLKSEAAAAADVCAAFHNYYEFMTADPPGHNLGVQAMSTMSMESLGVSVGNPQFPTMQDDVYRLLEFAAAHPIQRIDDSTPGVAGLRRQCH
jgi:hypothetical protein